MQLKAIRRIGINLDDTSFTHYSSPSLAVLDDQVGTFQKLVMEF
jgi:hypothetical protein